MNRFELEKESSLLYWYPKVKNTLRTPKTEVLVFSKKEKRAMYDVLDGEPIPDEIIRKIHARADKIGYPLFLRSDQGSGKHEWRETCYVPDREVLIKHVMQLIAWHECAGIMGLQWNALVFREFIRFESAFTSFWGMPVSRERRVFVRDGVVECIHPYWPEDSICEDRENPLPPDWKEQLTRLNDMSGEETGQLSYMGKIFGELVPGYWSVDFAYGLDNKWWLIDAARGEISWHPPDCAYCPDEQKPSTDKNTGSLIVALANLGEDDDK